MAGWLDGRLANPHAHTPVCLPSRVWQNLDVYRRALQSGAPVKWDGFASCSRSRKVALAFARAHVEGVHDDDRVLFTVLREPSRATAADISAFSAYPDEHEVLLLPHLRFRVLALHAREGFIEVLLQEVAGVYSHLDVL